MQAHQLSSRPHDNRAVGTATRIMRALRAHCYLSDCCAVAPEAAQVSLAGMIVQGCHARDA